MICCLPHRTDTRVPLIRIGIGLASLLVASASWAANIYIATNGNDAEDGRSDGHPVATLGRALDLAMAHKQYGSEPMRVLIKSGTYRGQKVVIDGSRLKGELSIIGEASDPKDFPIFVGDGSQSTWLSLKGRDGKRTGLTIQSIQIRDYFTAISLEGNRDAPSAFNAGTTIRRNVFRNIGSIAAYEGGKSTAAIRFVNSKNNLVESNFFHGIRNKRDKDCGALHSLYLAHFSSGNRIVDNTFEDACGSVVKLRDRSNDNVIESNRFRRIYKAPAIEEWFCDGGERKDCTKKLGECPSTGNAERGNDLSGSPSTEKISVLGESIPRAWCTSDDFDRPRVLSK